MEPVSSPQNFPDWEPPPGVSAAEKAADPDRRPDYTALFRHIFESAPFALGFSDRSGYFRICNQAFCKLFALSEEEVRNRTFLSLTHPLDRPSIRQHFQKLWSGEDGSVVIDCRYISGDGSVFGTQARIYLIYNGSAEPVGSVAMLTDNRGHKKVEAVRFRETGELEDAKSVAERRAARLGAIVEELQIARDNAEEATRSKSDFLAVMSHEIRTPMNGVVGITDLLLQTELRDEQRDLVETIRTSGESLIRIINDILDFSKVEAGRLDIEHEPFELRLCIEGALDIVSSTAASKHLSVAYLIDPEVPDWIVGDALRLRQILVNLLNNAIKFTTAGEVVLEVSVSLDEAPPVLHCAVRDTGIGIHEEQMAKLFQAFSQSDASTTRIYGGTGLGLVISKHLSEIMGGSIWVESEIDHGSTFHFTIALNPFDHPDGTRVSSISGSHVLVADRHGATGRMIRLQLERNGVSVTNASSEMEMLDLMKEGGFDLVIIEADLHRVDRHVSRTIKQQSERNNVPVIITHHLGQSIDRKGFYAAGFLTKPVKQAHLYRVLADTLGPQAAYVPPARSTTVYPPRMNHLPPLRVLLAEDNPINQKVALSMLKKLGFEAEVAQNGMEAVLAVERKQYDVILMDIMMPELDGIEAARRIIEDTPAERRPIIIALTANAMRGDRERCLNAGMDEYLTKPLRVSDLVAALENCHRIGRADERREGPGDGGEGRGDGRGDGGVDAIGGDNRRDGGDSGESGGSPGSGGIARGMDHRNTSGGYGGEGGRRAGQSSALGGFGTLDEAKAAVEPTALAALHQMLGGGDRDFLIDLIREFLTDSERLVDQIREAVRTSAFSALHMGAHTLKSSVAVFGANEMAATCERLESAGEERRLNDVPALMYRLEEQFEAVKRELQVQLD